MNQTIRFRTPAEGKFSKVRHLPHAEILGHSRCGRGRGFEARLASPADVASMPMCGTCATLP
jgi:hypothetical protein